MNTDKDMRLYTILIITIILDVSASMSQDNAIAAAKEALRQIAKILMTSATLAEKIRLEVMTFSDSANVVFPLGNIEEFSDWIGGSLDKIVADGDYTYYGKVFEKLLEDGNKNIAQIKSESSNYDVYRPAAILITDGDPNDPSAERDNAFEKLTDESNKYRPNILTVGIHEVNSENLLKYTAGTYMEPNREYRTGNAKMMYTQKDGVLPGEALAEAMRYFTNSIVNHANDGLVDKDGLPDPSLYFQEKNMMDFDTGDNKSDLDNICDDRLA